MKILYINDEFRSEDGSNYHALGILFGLEYFLGKENVIPYPEPQDGSKKKQNIKILLLKNKFKTILQIIRFFRKKIKTHSNSIYIIKKLNKLNFTPTHIISRSTLFDTTAIHVSKYFNAKLIYEINSPMFYESSIIRKEPLKNAIKKWEGNILRKSNYIYTVSEKASEMLRNEYRISKNKFIVIPNGYREDLFFENIHQREDIRKIIRNEESFEGKFIVTFFGSLKRWHGINELCKTALLLKEYKQIVFLVMGDGEMKNLILNYSSKNKNMIFKGKVDLDTMKKYLYASDLGIMPYKKTENFYFSPLKMFDMIGANLPFIGTKVGQIKEICEKNLSENFLFDNNDPYLMKDKILKIYNNELIHKEMFNMVQLYRKKASWKLRVNSLIEHLKELEG